jgi:ribosomal protein L40E
MDGFVAICMIAIVVLLVAAVYQRVVKKQCPECKTWAPRSSSRCRKCQASI